MLIFHQVQGKIKLLAQFHNGWLVHKLIKQYLTNHVSALTHKVEQALEELYSSGNESSGSEGGLSPSSKEDSGEEEVDEPSVRMRKVTAYH